MRSHRLKDSKGLTLIELMVAIAILAFGAVAGLMVMTQAQKTNNFSRAKTMALNAAEQQMEAIFMDAPSNVLTYNNMTFPVDGLSRLGGADAGLVTVSATQPREVVVSVVWQGQGSVASGQLSLRAHRSEAPR